MNFWQRVLLLLLGAGPLGLVGWLGALWLTAPSSQFPLETALHDDPRSPSSLNYALRKVADSTGPSTLPTRPAQARASALFGRAAAPNGTVTAGGRSADEVFEGKRPEQLIAEIAAMPPAEGSARALDVLAKMPADHAQSTTPLLLGYLRDNALPSRELAQSLLGQLHADRLEHLPNEESWRLLYAGLMWEAFQRLWADPSTSFTTWTAKTAEVNDPLWRKTLQSFAPPQAAAVNAAPVPAPVTPPEPPSNPVPPPTPEAQPAADSAVVVPVVPGVDPLLSVPLPAPAPAGAPSE